MQPNCLHTVIKRLCILLLASIMTYALAAQSQLTRTARGLYLLDDGTTVRALEPFRGNELNGKQYAQAVNAYRKALPDSIRIYNMLIPTAIAFYETSMENMPGKPQQPAIDTITAHLCKGVETVNVYHTLENHLSENLYFRTDHHWSPRAAYYAANEFCKIAGLDSISLDTFDADTLHRFVGSMYYFTKAAILKQKPDTFVYYRPKDVKVRTWFETYLLDKKRKVTGKTEKQEKDFFVQYPDGSSLAYCTFMGGDNRLTTIHTSTANGRRLLIIKDSYGNALPPFLMPRFETIIITDFRYFQDNILTYIIRHDITDVLIVNNMQHAYQARTANLLQQMLNQHQTK